jgi:hypothetical protein
MIGMYVRIVEIHLTVGTKAYEVLHKLCLQHNLLIEKFKMVTYGI